MKTKVDNSISVRIIVLNLNPVSTRICTSPLDHRAHHQFMFKS